MCPPACSTVRCRSSVVEHSLGKGEVVGSIPPGSTIFSQCIQWISGYRNPESVANLPYYKAITFSPLRTPAMMRPCQKTGLSTAIRFKTAKSSSISWKTVQTAMALPPEGSKWHWVSVSRDRHFRLLRSPQVRRQPLRRTTHQGQVWAVHHWSRLQEVLTGVQRELPKGSSPPRSEPQPAEFIKCYALPYFSKMKITELTEPRCREVF